MRSALGIIVIAAIYAEPWVLLIPAALYWLQRMAANRGRYEKAIRAPLMNATERAVYRTLMRYSGTHVFPQVGLASITGEPSCQRVDFALCDADANVLAVVEVNGGGHYQGDWRQRDARKASALAGVPLHTLAGTFGQIVQQARQIRYET